MPFLPGIVIHELVTKYAKLFYSTPLAQWTLYCRTHSLMPSTLHLPRPVSFAFKGLRISSALKDKGFSPLYALSQRPYKWTDDHSRSKFLCIQLLDSLAVTDQQAMQWHFCHLESRVQCLKTSNEIRLPLQHLCRPVYNCVKVSQLWLCRHLSVEDGMAGLLQTLSIHPTLQGGAREGGAGWPHEAHSEQSLRYGSRCAHMCNN